MASSIPERSAAVIAHNLRLLMAREGLSQSDLVEATGLDERTIRGVFRGVNQTRTTTLQKLASGLGVPVDVLFRPPLGMTSAAFDTATNPAVERALAANPELFEDWGAPEFGELASRFGAGGELTEEGAMEAAYAMNARRDLMAKARVVLESSHGDLLTGMINVLYERVTLSE